MSLSPSGGVAFHGTRVFVPFKHDGNTSRLAEFIRERYKDKITDLKFVGDKGVDIKFSTFSRAKSKLDLFDVDMSRIAFSKAYTRCYFSGFSIVPQMLPAEMERYCHHHQLRLKNAGEADIHKPTDGLFFGKFGAVSIKKSELKIVAVWKPFVLTFLRENLSTHYEFGTTSAGSCLPISSKVLGMKISAHKCYHGALFHETKIVDMITNKWNGPYQVVLSKPYVKMDSMYNVAVVHNAKWICVVCEKKFDEPVKWAQHFHHPVILNYSDTSWREARVSHGRLSEGNVYRYQISCPCTTYTQKSLMKDDIMNPKHDWLQKLLKKAISKASAIQGPFVHKSDVMMMNTNPAFTSWEDVGLSIQFLVELDRSKWDKQSQWSLQFRRDPHHDRNVALSYEESQERRRNIEAIRRVSIEIQKEHAAKIARLGKKVESDVCSHSTPKKRRVSEEESAEATPA